PRPAAGRRLRRGVGGGVVRVRHRSFREFSRGADLGKIAAGHQRNAHQRGQSQGEDGECAAYGLRCDPAEAGARTERIVPVLKQKLWLLNFALVGAIAAGGWQLRKQAQDFHQRERMTLGNKPRTSAAPPPPPATPAPAVAASSYLE